MEIYNCDRCGVSYEKHTQICLCPECEKILEKEVVAKKPLKSEREIRYCEVFKCPSCGFEFSGRVSKFCYRCGQKLDWGESSE